MIGIGVWQTVLDAIGTIVAKIYDVIPNYGVAIILLTILVRLVLLPLGIKQIRSMHAMQAVQPKIKAIQAKHKNDKQKAQAEIMKVYQEHGVNPLGGCLPLLLQMPVLISLYSVLRFPPPLPASAEKLSPDVLQARMVDALHVPAESALIDAITAQPTSSGVKFLGANILCSASQAGKQNLMPVTTSGQEGNEVTNRWPLDCGSGAGAKIPIYFFILLMVGTTYFQQWQMQRASPPGAAQKQQQMIMRVMPLMFLFFFWGYPSGMVLYWSVSNLWQIGQQHFLLRVIKKEQAETEAIGGKPGKATGKGPAKESAKGPAKESAKGPAKESKPAKKGLMQRMMEQAEAQRAAQEEAKRGKGEGTKPTAKPSQKKPPGQKPGEVRSPKSGQKKPPGQKKPKPKEGS